MTIGVFSDIHGNLGALRRVLTMLEGAEALYNLGDVVGRGDVNACMRLLAERGAHSVAGGHDLDALAPPDPSGLIFLNDDGSEIRDDFGLSLENKSVLRKLPFVRRLETGGDRYFFTHGLIVDSAHPGIMEVVDESNAAPFVSRFATADSLPPRAIFVGHSHIQRWFTIRGPTVIRGPEGHGVQEVSLPLDGIAIIDVGTVSVGSYALLDTNRKIVTMHPGA